jgi:hypothetical protein
MWQITVVGEIIDFNGLKPALRVRDWDRQKKPQLRGQRYTKDTDPKTAIFDLDKGLRHNYVWNCQENTHICIILVYNHIHKMILWRAVLP